MARLLLPVDGSCVLYLPFWEGAGTFTEDISRYKNHGTINGATWASGVLENGLSFDGANDYVGGALATTLSAFTVAVWVKSDRAYPAYIERAISIHNSGGGSMIRLYRYNDYFSWVAIFDSGLYTQRDLSIYSVWTHLVFVYDGAFLIGYVDGADPYFHSNPGVQTLTTTNYELGREYGAGNYFGGSLDEVRIFNRALSASEVFEEYYRGVRGNY